jgi:hypothetical protein
MPTYKVAIWFAPWCLLLLLALALSPQPALAAPGMVSWWQAENNASDSVGSNNGTLQGQAYYGTGVAGKGFQLNGINEFVNIPHSDTLNFGSADFSVGLWVKFASTSSQQVLIEKYIETENISTRQGWGLTYLGGNTLRLCGAISNSLGSIIDASPQFPIVTGTWYYAVVTRLGDTFTLYWNGEAVGTRDASLNLDSSPTTTLKIGHRGNPQDTPGSVDTRGFYFNGTVDEVGIYPHALGAAEIAYIYKLGGSRTQTTKTAVIPF